MGDVLRQRTQFLGIIVLDDEQSHSTFHIKNSVSIIYLLEDEQELSLGMLDTSPMYL